MVPSVRMLYPSSIIHLRQYHSSIHDFRVVQEWLSRQADVELLDWTPQVPDMNPIAYMWRWKGQCTKSGLSSLPEVAMSYGPLYHTRGMKFLRLRVTFDPWLSPWHEEWNQWSKKGYGLLIKEVNFWKQPFQGLKYEFSFLWVGAILGRSQWPGGIQPLAMLRFVSGVCSEGYC